MRCKPGKVFALALLLAGVGRAWAQEVQPTTFPARTTQYYSAEGKRLASARGASYRVETTYRDSLTGIIRAYYPSGKLKTVSPYGNLSQRLLHGTKTSWFESGQQHTREDYVAGQRHGELLVYYPTGQLRRREVYQKGWRQEAACFGPAGQAVPYTELLQAPVYSGGSSDIESVLRDMVRKGIYPEAVSQMEMDARIVVVFTVNDQGHVQDARALDAPKGTVYPRPVATAFKRLQDEAVWLVQHLKPFKPALLDGEPTDYTYTTVINFKVL